MTKPTQKWILIVDDDAEFAGVLKTSLEKHGFRVLTCHEASKATQVLQNQRFACAIVDNHLGGVQGATILTNIKKNNYHMNFHTPFIFITGDPDLDTLKKVAKNVTAALVKPFPIADLVSRIAEVVAAATTEKPAS